MSQSLTSRLGTSFRAHRAGVVDDGYMVRMLTGEHRSARTERAKTRIVRLLHQHFSGQWRFLPNGAVVPA